MLLRAYFESVATTYDRSLPLSSPAQTLLRGARVHLNSEIPAGYSIIGSGGQGNATFTPWVGILDPDETVSPQKGLYLAYLFSEDLKTLIFSLQQGITELTKQFGGAEARGRLRADAEAIRSRMGDAVDGLAISVNFGSRGNRQLTYESGNVVAISYDAAALPSEMQMVSDLRHMLRVYQEAIAAKRYLLLAVPGTVSSSSPPEEGNGLRYFAPKSSEEYVAKILATDLVKSRRHERLIAEYGSWLMSRGLRPATTVHPRDLVVATASDEWLVEAKVVYRGDATTAVRAATGQLLTYSHFLYQGHKPPMLALFSEDVGDAMVQFLQTIAVESVWPVGDVWIGSALAVHEGLASALRD